MLIGVDLGSRTVKLTAIEDGVVVERQLAESGFEPHIQAVRMLAPLRPRWIVATGYGRHLAKKKFAQEVITEIKAHSLGARHFFPACRTILDIGGQDCKVIALDEQGKVASFQMNDKCAAGTGRFLEIMAATLGFSLAEFGPAALESPREEAINSMCTVFAESEVISMKNSGIDSREIAKGIHLAVVQRILAMLNRLPGPVANLLFSGGVARNPCIVQLLRERLAATEIIVPPHPDQLGALGAALNARQTTGATR